MQSNLQVEGINNGGSEQASSSDDGQLLVALRKMMKKEVEVTVIRTVQQVILPTIGDLVRKIVKEEIQSVEKKLLTEGTRNANEMTMSTGRSLLLKFLDEVSGPVLTGKVLKGKGDNSLRVALVDRATGQVVKSGPESSAKVEIVVLDASGDDNEHNWTLENFNDKIIGEGDKKKPHFAKNSYIYLTEGVGVLSNANLGHGEKWTKSCKCRLGARIVENLRGINVQEARTESFMVKDSRGKLYEKHYPPSLSDKVWRLDNIGRDGPPCKRLKKEKIETVQDFRFMLSIDPQRLKRIVGAGAKMWKTTVDHAGTCTIDDENLYLHYPPTEPKMGVIFDAVGGLKGLINESHYVPNNNLAPDEKDCAHNLLLSAFENQEDRTSFADEASLLQQFPYRSSDGNASTNSSSNGRGLSISENIDECYYPAEPGTLSQSTTPYIQTFGHLNNTDHFDVLESTDTGQISNPFLGDPTHFLSSSFPDLENMNGCAPTDPGSSSQSMIRTFADNNFHFGSPESPTMGLLYDQFYCPDFSLGGNWSPMPVMNSETLRAEQHCHNQQSRDRACRVVVNAMLWVLRAKKRVTASGGVHVQKKQRI